MVSGKVLVTVETTVLSAGMVEVLMSEATTIWVVEDELITLMSFVVWIWVPVTLSTTN
jgi:hypothetical protein